MSGNACSHQTPLKPSVTGVSGLSTELATPVPPWTPLKLLSYGESYTSDGLWQRLFPQDSIETMGQYVRNAQGVGLANACSRRTPLKRPRKRDTGAWVRCWQRLFPPDSIETAINCAITSPGFNTGNACSHQTPLKRGWLGHLQSG